MREKAQALVNALHGEARSAPVDRAYMDLRAELEHPSAEDLDAVAEEEKAKEITAKPTIIAGGKKK